MEIPDKGGKKKPSFSKFERGDKKRKVIEEKKGNISVLFFFVLFLKFFVPLQFGAGRRALRAAAAHRGQPNERHIIRKTHRVVSLRRNFQAPSFRTLYENAFILCDQSDVTRNSTRLVDKNTRVRCFPYCSGRKQYACRPCAYWFSRFLNEITPKFRNENCMSSAEPLQFSAWAFGRFAVAIAGSLKRFFRFCDFASRAPPLMRGRTRETVFVDAIRTTKKNNYYSTECCL